MFSVSDFQRRRAGKFGFNLYYYEQLDSTNTAAEALAREGCPEGTVVFANEQLAGRGRKGNEWFSPADVNLYFSIVLRPDTGSLKYLPYILCLAVQRALATIGIDADIKWPNDVLVNEKKICGILIQTAMEESQLQFVVAGCGINVNAASFPPEIAQAATSVFMEKKSAEPREPFLAMVLLELERLYEKINRVAWSDFAADLEKASTYLRGRTVQVVQEGHVLEGVTRGLDSFGGLVLETADGPKTVYAGEVISCRKKQPL